MARPAVRSTFSQPGPSHPAAAVRLARTLGVSQTAAVVLVAESRQVNFAVCLARVRHGLVPRRTCRALRSQICSASVAHPPSTGSAHGAPPAGRADSRALTSNPAAVSTSFLPRSTASSSTARRLTPRLTTGPATAGRQARAGGARYILTSPGLASCRSGPVSSNVRPRRTRVFLRRLS